MATWASHNINHGETIDDILADPMDSLYLTSWQNYSPLLNKMPRQPQGNFWATLGKVTPPFFVQRYMGDAPGYNGNNAVRDIRCTLLW